MPRVCLVVVLALAVAGCESRDVKQDLQITNVRTGWYDVGKTDAGLTKIVPSISLDIKNVDRKSTRLNSSHVSESRMPSSA